MKNKFNEAVISNTEEVKGGLFLLKKIISYKLGYLHHGHNSYGCGCKKSKSYGW